MKPSFLRKHPELFQGQTQLDSSSYFEGWYFKHSVCNFGISFIPGIQITKEKKSAFLQIITPETSYYISYGFSCFSYQNFPFFIQIGDNFFSENLIDIQIEDEKQNLSLHGRLLYGNLTPIHKTKLSPNIMGPFSYLPFMECNHAILSMKHCVNGNLVLNDINYTFNHGIGYIEKDWGCSFPSSYIWLEGNEFQNPFANFFFSVATIPFKVFSFPGFICVLQLENKEYRFATYTKSQIKTCMLTKDRLEISIKKGSYLLTISCEDWENNSLELLAPKQGEMNQTILESITATLHLTLQKNGHILFHDTSPNCGLEIV